MCKCQATPNVKFFAIGKNFNFSKKPGNAGYDVYARLNGHLLIMPNETKIIPTGLYTEIPEGYYFQLFERGSTGIKGMGQRAGVIDSNYRGEWLVPITNHNNCPILITHGELDSELAQAMKEDGAIIYDDMKAICQAVLLRTEHAQITRVSAEEYAELIENSERKDGRFGSSGK